MTLTPMRFKSFTWPHNPESYTIQYRRRIAASPVPFGSCVLQDLGGSYRVLKGEGVFAGQDAYEQFKALAQVFQEDGPGLLVHPVWQTERAYFAALEVTEEPLPNFVRYSFEFWEDWPGYDTYLKDVTPAASSETAAPAQTSQNRGSHTVCKGDTLWAIAKRYSVSLASLLQANPQIKNPNLIYPGQVVNIP